MKLKQHPPPHADHHHHLTNSGRNPHPHPHHLINGWQAEGVRSCVNRKVCSKRPSQVAEWHPEGAFWKSGDMKYVETKCFCNL